MKALGAIGFLLGYFALFMLMEMARNTEPPARYARHRPEPSSIDGKMLGLALVLAFAVAVAVHIGATAAGIGTFLWWVS